MTQLTEAVAPAKFTSLAAQLILVLVITYTYEENIYGSIALSYSKTSDEYLVGERSVLTCIALSVLLLCFQIVTLFTGVSLFYDRMNAVRNQHTETFLNCMGVFWLSWYIHSDAGYNFLWAIWFVSILVPAVMELLIVVRVRNIYKSKV